MNIHKIYNNGVAILKHGYIRFAVVCYNIQVINVYFKYTVKIYSAHCNDNFFNVQYTCVLFQGTSHVAVSHVKTELHASIWPRTNQTVSHQVGTKMT